MSVFKLTSKYQPTGDQPEAIRQLTDGVERGDAAQVLLGVTGSGKTFTVANVIANVNKPTLILSHNKTLAAQLYEEMKGFFPENAVEYYVSYYDYYQPEAYLPSSDTYIEKDLAINDEIDRLRLSAVSNLLSGRKDVIVVSSVSCIYGMGSPVALQENVIELHTGQKLDRNMLLRRLVAALYTNSYTIPSTYRRSYHFAVCVVDRFGNEFAPRFSDEEELPLAESPQLVWPDDSATFRPAVHLMWKATAADQYVLEVSRNKRFTDLVLTAHTGWDEENGILHYSTEESFWKEGTYYWRVRASEVNSEEASTEIRSFTVSFSADEDGTGVADMAALSDDINIEVRAREIILDREVDDLYVYNMQGQLLAHRRATRSYRFDTPRSGIFIVKATCERQHSVHKVFVR